MLVRNISNGIRGIRNQSGVIVWLEADQEADIDLAAGETEGDWFKFGESPLADLIAGDADLIDIPATEPAKRGRPRKA